MPWSPEVPFNDLPHLPPTGMDLEPKPVLKAAIEARTALATLAQAGQLLPNPNILIHAVPLANGVVTPPPGSFVENMSMAPT